MIGVIGKNDRDLAAHIEARIIVPVLVRSDNAVTDKDQARFLLIDSNLSEAGVLGFEYGFASADPRNLVIWESKDARGRSAPVPPPAAPQEQRADASASSAKREENEYAATGMGERTGHAVSQVWMDLEDAPAQTVNIRYEFRPQLVRLGVVPPAAAAGHLERRERARGFEPAFCPEPPRR